MRSPGGSCSRCPRSNRLPAGQRHLAGGKAATLARLAQAGYPVPQGFVIPPAAFAGEALRLEAWAQIEGQLAAMRASAQGAAFAVRSSAFHEDSAQASFAGEFETVLNVVTDTEILAAIGTVRRSAQSERVQAYSAAQGIAPAHQLAVLIQVMVPAELAGVLFTAIGMLYDCLASPAAVLIRLYLCSFCFLSYDRTQH
jgi:phosphoenolpyruvate synthase/pyruvate phosphate dikinase